MKARRLDPSVDPSLERVASPRDESRSKQAWVVYILECADGTLYTGVTNDLERRHKAHEAGRGARYLRGRGPLTVKYVESAEGKSAALSREHAIKRLDRRAKLSLIHKARA